VTAKKNSNKGRKARKESLRSVYARIRREFTAAELQRYTEVEEGIPAEQILADMESIHRRETAKRKKS
jgi:hypothetical protein